MASLTAWKFPFVSRPAASPNVPAVQDASVLALAKRGDRSARAALLDELQDVMFRCCVSMLGRPEAARDATQETALRFLQGIGGFRGESGLRTWALGIALNVCREARRGKDATPVTLDDGWARASGEETPEHHAATAEEHEMLRSLIETLPDRQREVVVLRFIEELSVDETAAAMGCAAGTVKATTAHALRALREKWSRKP
jgi:RNA polymerase sigma-70 factor (ECF subfamily)